jgi:hypothetical protein
MQVIHSFSKDNSVDAIYRFFTNTLFCKANPQLSLPIPPDYLDKLLVKLEKIFDD